MEAVLRQYVPPEGTYLELIFEKLVTPWYRGIGTRGAQVYTRVSAEIRLLKEKKEKKAQHKTQVIMRFIYAVHFIGKGEKE